MGDVALVAGKQQNLSNLYSLDIYGAAIEALSLHIEIELSSTARPLHVLDHMMWAWTNFSLQDKPWAEFTTLEVAACKPCTYCPV